MKSGEAIYETQERPSALKTAVGNLQMDFANATSAFRDEVAGPQTGRSD